MSGAFENPSLQATATAAEQRQLARVTVSTTPVLAAMPREDERPDFQVLVRVQAPTSDAAAALRARIDLVAVLDVSGSMSRSPDKDADPEKGKPSRLDLLKDAMKFIVDHLHAGDRLAIVAFDHNVVAEYSSADFMFTEISDSDAGGKERDTLKAKVDAMAPRGGTLFAPALDKTLAILEEENRRSPEYRLKRRVGFIVFLSDGQEGVVTSNGNPLVQTYPHPNDWRREEILRRLKAQTVHTFGFSKFHDPMSLSAIAEASAGGTFSYLREGLAKITNAFALCLGGLQTVVATDVTVRVAVHDANVRITGVDSGGYAKSVATDGRSGRIAIPVLYADEAKEFIVHLNVPRHGTGRQMLLTTDGQWRRTTSASAAEDVAAAVAAVEIEEDDLVIKRPVVAADGEQQRPNGRVMELVLRFKVLEMVDEFLNSADLSKKVDKAASAAAAAEAEASLGAKWASLKGESSSSSLWGALPDGVVSRYEEYVAEMRSSLKSGDGGAYVAAWRSSYRMQRVTTMGSPEKVVPEFKTEAIEKMGEEAAKKLAPAPAPAAAEPVDGGQQVPAPPPVPEDEERRRPAAVAPEERLWPCACPEYDMVGRQLAYWCVVKRDLLRLVRQVEGDGGGHHNLTGTFHDLSLASINRAMHESVFLAVEHAHNTRSCYRAATGQNAVAAAGYDGEER